MEVNGCFCLFSSEHRNYILKKVPFFGRKSVAKPEYCLWKDMLLLSYFNTLRATDEIPFISIVWGCRQTSQRLIF